LWRVRVTIVDTEKQKYILRFCTLFQTARFLYKEIVGYKMRVLIFSTILSEKVLITRILRNVISIRRSSCKTPLIFCEILMKLEFSSKIFEKSSSIKLKKTVGPMGAEFQADRWTTRS
jgi:hypothetical protein